MTRMSGWFTSLICAGAVSVMMSGSAQAALYGFTIAPFTDGASLTVQFEGADNNGDGVIYGYYPSDCGCEPHPTEVTSLSLSFSGNSLIPSFTASSVDFSSPLQTLTFDVDLGDGFELFYVISPSGPGVAYFGMPSGVVAGDASIGLGGMVGGGGGPRGNAFSSDFTEPTYVETIGAPCGSVLGIGGGLSDAPCAYLFYDDQNANVDFAFQDVPEPISLVTFGAGLVGLGLVRRRTARA